MSREVILHRCLEYQSLRDKNTGCFQMVRKIEEGEIAEVLELSIDTIKAWEEEACALV